MKKHYYSLLAAATMLLATTSCSQDEELVRPSGEMTTFKVELNGAANSRTAGDGQTVNKLYYAVYDKGGTQVIYPNGKSFEKADISEGKASVDIPLMKSEAYDIVFWAQNDETNAYSFSSLTEITVNYPADGTLLSNQENRDAFFNSLNDFKANGETQTVYLKRPFAQLNVATSIDDWNEALRQYQANGGTDYPVKNSSVTIDELATTFNAKTGVAEGETSAEVTFAPAGLIDESIWIKGTDADGNETKLEYKLLAMNYVLMASDKKPQDIEEHKPALGDDSKTTIEVDFTLWKGEAQAENEIMTANVPFVPIQRNYRTNIIGSFLTGDQTQFNIVVDADFDNPDENIVVDYANDDEDLERLLKQDEERIVIELASSNGRAVGKTYSINIGAWQEEYYWGSERTKSITIHANGNTLNFIHNNTDWNYIRCINDEAKWIINDAHLTNSGKNDGPWNRHDIRFYNAVELNNVTSDKAIALLNDGKLTKVEISDARQNDDYGLWITTQGQTVELDGCTFNMIKEGNSTGRGIAIKDEYVDEADRKPVTLTIKNTSFNTEAKAAILVTSTVGADIKLENVDLSGVTKDGFNAVWVDEDHEEHFDLVTVTGGFKVLEGNEETVNPFEIEGNTVELPAGTYKFPSKVAKGVTIKCAEGVVFAGNTRLDINGATVEGATFSNPEGTAVDQTINGTFRNCTFTGQNALRWCYAGETVVFENCVFSGDVYGVHFDGGTNEAIFKHCTFSGFNAFGAAITLLTLEDCIFQANGKSSYNGANLWGNTNLVRTNFVFDGTASTEWIGLKAAESGKTISLTDCKVNDGNGSVFDYFTSFNGGDKVTVDNVKYALASTSEELVAAIEKVNEGDIISLVKGEYEGHFDVTGKKSLTLVSLDKQATIKGMLWADNCNVTVKGLTLTNPEGVQHPNPQNSQYYNTINNQYPLVGAYNKADIKFEDCTFEIVGPTVYGFYGYAHNSPVFEGCTFNCNKIRPIANNGPALTINGCTFNDQYHYAARIFENSNEKQTVVFTNNIIQGSNDKGEFEGINISKKGSTATVLGDFTIKGNTADVKYRHHKDVTMSEGCNYDTDIANFAFEKEN